MADETEGSSKLWLCLRFLLSLRISLTSDSLLSTNTIHFLRLGVLLGRLDLLTGWISSSIFSDSGMNLLYWQKILAKKIVRVMKHAMPHIRKRPQKLVRASLFESTSTVVHSFLLSHLSWILCRSPLSESWRMAVERSTARGESLWNACCQGNIKSKQTIPQYRQYLRYSD